MKHVASKQRQANKCFVGLILIYECEYLQSLSLIFITCNFNNKIVLKNLKYTPEMSNFLSFWLKLNWTWDEYRIWNEFHLGTIQGYAPVDIHNPLRTDFESNGMRLLSSFLFSVHSGLLFHFKCEDCFMKMDLTKANILGCKWPRTINAMWLYRLFNTIIFRCSIIWPVPEPRRDFLLWLSLCTF